LNVGLLQAKVEHPFYRGVLGIHTGVYSIDNYAAEPQGLQNIFEAYVGINLSRKKELWLDMGVFTSHIGFESAISMDNWTLSRSLLAEHSPYYLSGARLVYQPNRTWEIVGVVCNGWQRIQRVQGSSLLSFGTQVKYMPSDKFTFNWSTFIGSDDADEDRRMRYFNNFFAQLNLSSTFQVIGGYDFGYQQKIKGEDEYSLWYSPVVVARYHLSDTWKVGLRAEYFGDADEVIVPTQLNRGFQTSGLSINFDYLPTENIAWRIEARNLQAEDAIYGTGTDSKFIVMTSLALRI
jgi:hypothetical protein